MAIVVENLWTDSEGTNQLSFVFTLGATPTEGNVLVAFITKDDNADPTTSPAGWTELFSDAAGTSTFNLSVWYKIAGAAEPTTPTWTISSTGQHWCGACYELSGVDTTAIINASNFTQDLTGSTAPTSPTINTTTDGCLIMAGFAHDNNNQTITKGLEGGLTSRYNQASVVGFGACDQAGGSESQVSSGATGTYVHSIDVSKPNYAYTIAIAPTVLVVPQPKVILGVGSNKPIIDSLGALVSDKTYNYALVDGSAIATATLIQAGTLDLVSGEVTITITGGAQIVTDPVILVLQDPDNGERLGAYELVVSEVS